MSFWQYLPISIIGVETKRNIQIIAIKIKIIIIIFKKLCIRVSLMILKLKKIPNDIIRTMHIIRIVSLMAVGVVHILNL